MERCTVGASLTVEQAGGIVDASLECCCLVCSRKRESRKSMLAVGGSKGGATNKDALSDKVRLSERGTTREHGANRASAGAG